MAALKLAEPRLNTFELQALPEYRPHMTVAEHFQVVPSKTAGRNDGPPWDNIKLWRNAGSGGDAQPFGNDGVERTG